MSLDVYLTGPRHPQADLVETEAIFVRRDGSNVAITREEWDRLHPGIEPVTVTIKPGESDTLFSANITHNLGKMANAVGIYRHLWRPEEVGVKVARDLIEPLTKGLEMLESNRALYEAHNPPNGWGDYDGLVRFINNYLDACEQYPDATVGVWR